MSHSNLNQTNCDSTLDINHNQIIFILLFFFSELLPFVNYIQANGLLHFLILFAKALHTLLQQPSDQTPPPTTQDLIEELSHTTNTNVKHQT